jgi:hypothetical protein
MTKILIIYTSKQKWNHKFNFLATEEIVETSIACSNVASREKQGIFILCVKDF